MGAELFLADGRSKTTKLIVAFRNFANAHKKETIQFTANSFFIRHKINLASQLLTSFKTIVLCIVQVFCIIGQEMIILGRNMLRE